VVEEKHYYNLPVALIAQQKNPVYEKNIYKRDERGSGASQGVRGKREGECEEVLVKRV
jgi:hypothetical protein